MSGLKPIPPVSRLRRYAYRIYVALSALFLIALTILWATSYSRYLDCWWNYRGRYFQLAAGAGDVRFLYKSQVTQAYALDIRQLLNDSSPPDLLKKYWPWHGDPAPPGLHFDTMPREEEASYIWQMELEGSESETIHPMFEIPWVLHAHSGYTVNSAELPEDRGYLSYRVPLRYAQMPLLWPTLFFTLLVARAFFVWFKEHRRRRFMSKNLCLACRYDLRAHQPGDKCPECGTIVEMSVTR